MPLSHCDTWIVDRQWAYSVQRVPDCLALGGLSRVGISSRSTRPWNGQPPSLYRWRDRSRPFLVVVNDCCRRRRLSVRGLCRGRADKVCPAPRETTLLDCIEVVSLQTNTAEIISMLIRIRYTTFIIHKSLALRAEMLFLICCRMKISINQWLSFSQCKRRWQMHGGIASEILTLVVTIIINQLHNQTH